MHIKIMKKFLKQNIFSILYFISILTIGLTLSCCSINKYNHPTVIYGNPYILPITFNPIIIDTLIKK